MRKSKRIFIICMIGAVFFLSGCSERKEKQVEITVMHGWGSTEMDHKEMQKIYSDFQKKYPDISLNLIAMPTGKEMVERAEDRILVGDLPDVIFCGDAGKESLYQFMIENELALDLMPYIKEDKELLHSIAPSSMEYWKTKDGKLYTVSDVLMLGGGYWYNEEIFREAGITSIPETWEEFYSACQKIQTWSETSNKDVMPLGPTVEGYLYITDQMLAKNRGRGSVAISQNKVPMSQSEICTVLEQQKELWHYTKPLSKEYSYRDETDLFNDGKLAMYINGIWGAFMIDETLPVSYALLPFGEGAEIACESAGLGYLLGNTENEKRIDASIKFLKYMLSKEVQERILLKTGQMPANPQITIEQYSEKMPRFCQAATEVKQAEIKIQVPANLWNSAQMHIFEEYLPVFFQEEMSGEVFFQLLERNSQNRLKK